MQDLTQLSDEQLNELEERTINEVAQNDLRQKALKLQMNGLYGVIGNGYFRYYDRENAEAVTSTGRFIIQYVAREINRKLNQILQTADRDYVIYIDTDSVYLDCKALVEKAITLEGPKTKEDIVDWLDAFSVKFERFIAKVFDRLSKTVLNGVGDYLAMKREAIAEKGSWGGKKRYILNVNDFEGVRYAAPSLKYIGVEIAKATSPKFCRDAMLQAVKLMMEGDQEKLQQHIIVVEEQFQQLRAEDIAFPRSVNGLAKYGDEATVVKAKSGAPFPVKGALWYNHLVRTLELAHYPLIKEGERIKYLYLTEPNRTGGRVISFLNVLPKEFELHAFVDYEMQFSKAFLEPLQLILNPVGWHTAPIATLNSLWS